MAPLSPSPVPLLSPWPGVEGGVPWGPGQGKPPNRSSAGWRVPALDSQLLYLTEGKDILINISGHIVAYICSASAELVLLQNLVCGHV